MLGCRPERSSYKVILRLYRQPEPLGQPGAPPTTGQRAPLQAVLSWQCPWLCIPGYLVGWHFPGCLFYLCVCLALWDSELLPRCLFVSAFLVFKLSNTVLGSGDSFEGAGNLTPLPLGAACTWIWVVPSRGCIYLGVRVWRLGETGVRGRSRDCVDLKPGEPAGACIWGLRPLELEDFPILGGLPGPVHK